MFKKVIILVCITLMLLSGSALAANELKIGIWFGYLSADVVKKFESTYGIKIVETHFNTYDEALAIAEKGEVDMLITGELIIPTLINKGYLEPLNKSLIPNMENLDPLFKNLNYDPTNTYMLPYHYIYIGLIYDKQKVSLKDATLQNYFETPAQFKGKITTYPDKRVMIGFALKYFNQSMNDMEKKNLDMAKLLLQSFKPNLTVEGTDMTRNVIGNYQEILDGKAVMSIGYCAESTRTYYYKAKDKIGFVIPREGAMAVTDAMTILKTAKNKDAAHKFINFIYNPEIAALSVNTFGNPFPVKDIKKHVLPEIANNPEIYPPTEVSQKLEFFKPKTDAELNVYNKLWEEVFGK